DSGGESARLQLERPARAAELAEQLLVNALSLLGVKRHEPLAGGADAAIHRLPELLEVPVAGGHVELGGLDLAVRREQVMNLLRSPVAARLSPAHRAHRL